MFIKNVFLFINDNYNELNHGHRHISRDILFQHKYTLILRCLLENVYILSNIFDATFVGLLPYLFLWEPRPSGY